MILGITGTNGSGKGTVVEYLVRKKGFTYFSAREILIEEIKRRGLGVDRDMTQFVANDLRKIHGPEYLAKEMIRRAENAGGNAVVESIRCVGEVDFLKGKPTHYLLAVDADIHLRYDRIQNRQTELDGVSFEKFSLQEKKELANPEPFSQNISACMKLADASVHNNGSLEELYAQVDAVLEKFNNRD